MLASAPLIVLVCLLLSYLKGQHVLYLICVVAILYCVRRHTFKPAAKRRSPRLAGASSVIASRDFSLRRQRLAGTIAARQGATNVYTFPEPTYGAELLQNN